jgi:hypothetical protein
MFEEHTASIFRNKNKPFKEKLACDDCSAYCLSLKVGAGFYQDIRLHIPDDSTLLHTLNSFTALTIS